jgi:[glutamine synthetase] adenylyltransferase / [glutamine synthetase]-adenylyl-L-tyrosine phosphorylase
VDNPIDMTTRDVRDLLLAARLDPPRVEELLRPYGFRDPLAADRDLAAIAEDPTARERLAALLPDLLGAVSASADPQGALSRLERFARASGRPAALLSHLATDPRMIDVLALTFGASPFMAEILIRHPVWFYWLSEPGVLGRARTKDEMTRELVAAVDPLRSHERRLDALRLAKRREILHIGVRDLLRHATVDETVATLSALAEALIEAACVVAEDGLRASLGLRPLRTRGRAGAARAGFTVLGLGKLGGGELNFSSDVDLVYLYASDRGRVPGGPSTPDRGDYFQALARRLTAALADVTGEGYVYRVDLRLRPEGKSGPVAQSLRSFEEYYRSRGATWERLALLKAWPVGGDRVLGTRFLERVRPFVYGRAFDSAALEDVRRVKHQIDQKIARRAESHRHVKLGVGGIREIEFACQVLQIRYGGRHRSLRERGTLGALDALLRARLLAREEHDALVRAYLFLRDVENKLQMVSDAQVHALPEAPEEVRACALRMGYRDRDGMNAPAALLSDYHHHTQVTHRIFEDVMAGPRLFS